jgi:hypothetical protein
MEEADRCGKAIVDSALHSEVPTKVDFVAL